MMLTDADRQLIESVRAAEAKATPGPWEIWDSNSHRRITGPDGRDGGVLSAIQCRDGCPDFHGYNRERDLGFIALVRNSIPALLAIIERLGAEITQLRGAISRAGFAVGETSGDWFIDDVSELGKAEYEQTKRVIVENIDLRAELAELRAQLARVTASHRENPQ